MEVDVSMEASLCDVCADQAGQGVSDAPVFVSPPATVLYLVDGLGLSGKTKALADLACGLDPRRYRAAVCCFDRGNGPLPSRLERRAIQVHEVLCPDGLHPGTIPRLMSVMRAVGADLIHGFNP